MKRLIAYGGLFTSLGTLLCCAIPSLLVMLGFGAALAGFIGDYPQLVWLSENKGLVFGLSFLMLGVSYLSSRNKVCPIDKKEDCEAAQKWSKPLFLVSLGINVVGIFYAFILPKL